MFKSNLARLEVDMYHTTFDILLESMILVGNFHYKDLILLGWDKDQTIYLHSILQLR